MDIDKHVNYLHKDVNKVLIINYNTEKIVFFNEYETYAYIGNIHAYVYYLKCEDNTMIFANIDDKRIKYLLKINENIQSLSLNDEFNIKDFHDYSKKHQHSATNSDNIKLDYIHDKFSKSRSNKYETSITSIDTLLLSTHNDYNLKLYDDIFPKFFMDSSQPEMDSLFSGQVPLAITCTDIDRQVNYLHKDVNKVLIIHYNTEKIIFFSGIETYAYIGNMNAYVYYLKCNDNTMIFANIEDKNIMYSLKINENIQSLSLNAEFNIKDFHDYSKKHQQSATNSDNIKLDYIHDKFSKSRLNKYDISITSIDRLLLSSHNDYNLKLYNDIFPDLFMNFPQEELYSLFSDNRLHSSQNIDQEMSVERTSAHKSGLNVMPDSNDATSQDLNNDFEQPSTSKKLRVNEVSSQWPLTHIPQQVYGTGAIVDDKSPSEKVTLENFLPELKDFITNNINFKEQYRVLYEIKSLDDQSLNEIDNEVYYNEVLKNLNIGHSLLFVNKKLKIIPEGKIRNNDTIGPLIIKITKINALEYELKRYKIFINPLNGLYDFALNEAPFIQSIYFTYRVLNKKMRFVISVKLPIQIIVDNYYIIGELSIKNNMDLLLRGVNIDTTRYKNSYSMGDLLQYLFNGNHYVYDEHSYDHTNSNKLAKYLNDNFRQNDKEELFVFIKSSFLNEFSEDNLRSNQKVGIILKLIWSSKGLSSIYKIEYIYKSIFKSKFIIEDPHILSDIIFYGYINKALIMNININPKTTISLSNYRLIRKY